MLSLKPAIAASALAVAALSALPAQAHHEPRHGVRYAGPSQYDRPGDYRCDRFWDANRDDCGAAWRDQRRYTHSYGHGNGYRYGHAYQGNWGHQAGGRSYEGAYGRPDIVFPGHGHQTRTYNSYGHSTAARDPYRADWCRRTYRSYDPATGFYRTYDGRLVFCG